MDEVMIALAAAVAGKVGESLAENLREPLKRLRRALRERFRDAPDARAALEAAQDDHDDAVAVEELAGHIASVASTDAEIAELVARLRPHVATGRGDVVNTIHGDVSGTAIQAGEIHGDIRL
ncbi:hypothetical protein ACQEU5_12330 [Marinactinospora thermotolerans]|uniref:Uncharacterized protein n=1 Tax=Marinactinospora thermotolerans DSM 45154 TaxID=1122192 RepID=A0A1T4SY47_9ACTN|nr:hypothetical protein [Marinactinospora thermotolerans]SKA32841.1 hypothetical protein SAMN02745673_04090 [Marinactinospora thermotolerans DSM 45154]